jgi:RNA polymerase sigma-70 factor (ECF subfamily)
MFVRTPGALFSTTCAAAVSLPSEVAAASGAEVRDAPARGARATHFTLAEVYREHSSFVWRLARRLGVSDAQIEDAVQDVFVVVHRRLGEFEGRSSMRTWLAGIVRRVVHDYRRTRARKPAVPTADSDLAGLPSSNGSPEASVLASEATRMLHLLLDQLDDDKREIFILAELEQWSMSEIAEATGTKINTVSSRLRLAREAFEQAAQRLRARDEWRMR